MSSSSTSSEFTDTTDETDLSVHRSSPIDIPSRVSINVYTPAPTPDSAPSYFHPRPSPDISGLFPPENTPQIPDFSPYYDPNSGIPYDHRLLFSRVLAAQSLAFTFPKQSTKSLDNTQAAISSQLVLLTTIESSINMADFTSGAEKDVNTPQPKPTSVPPHLRGRVQSTKPHEKAHQQQEKLIEPVENEVARLLMEPAQVSGDSTMKPSVLIPHEKEATRPEMMPTQVSSDSFTESSVLTSEAQADRVDNGTGTSAMAALPAATLDAVGQGILRLIDAIEATGYLSFGASLSLREVRTSVEAKINGKPNGPHQSTKINRGSAAPIDKQSIAPISTAQASGQLWREVTQDQEVTSRPGLSSNVAPLPTSTSETSAITSADHGPPVLKRKLPDISNNSAKGLASANDTPRDVDTSSKIPKLQENVPNPAMTPPASPKATTSPPAIAAKTTFSKLKAAQVNVLTTVPATGKDTENREHMAYFPSWGNGERRDGPAAETRKVILTNLPKDATPTFVAGLIYGGPIDDLHLLPGGAIHSPKATVRFMNVEHCKKYIDDTSNGLVYGRDAHNREMVVFVELAKDVDVVGGLLRSWIEQGFTRCVRAVGVEEEWDYVGLKKLAEMKGRKFEGLKDAINPAGLRAVVWRFCKVEDAVQFKAALVRDEEWEHCNIHFAQDPCTLAKGVHLDK